MKSQVDAIFLALDADPNPFFQCLAAGEMSREDFAETQVQFFSAVSHFHQPMSVLAERIPEAQDRARVLQNVAEERGKGDPSESHESTYLRFLNRLDGLTEESVRSRPVWDEVLAFNAAVDRACGSKDFRHAAALMGMIELLFSRISGQIGQAVLTEAWLQEDELVHYSTHAELDLRHAEDFFNVVRPHWGSRPELIVAGLEEGAAILDGLYRDLYAHRERRFR